MACPGPHVSSSEANELGTLEAIESKDDGWRHVFSREQAVPKAPASELPMPFCHFVASCVVVLAQIPSAAVEVHGRHCGDCNVATEEACDPEQVQVDGRVAEGRSS